MFDFCVKLVICESDLLQELGSHHCDDQAGSTRSSSVSRVTPYLMRFCLNYLGVDILQIFHVCVGVLLQKNCA